MRMWPNLRRKGLSLTELLIGAVLLLGLSVVISRLLAGGFRTLGRASADSGVRQEAMQIFDVLQRDLRMTSHHGLSFSTNLTFLQRMDGGRFGGRVRWSKEWTVYRYNPSRTTLQRLVFAAPALSSELPTELDAASQQAVLANPPDETRTFWHVAEFTASYRNPNLVDVALALTADNPVRSRKFQRTFLLENN